MVTKLRRYFLSGLVIFLPLALTVKLFLWIFYIADGFLGKYIEPYFAREFGFYFRGVSILICLLLILLIGFLGTNFLGRRIYPFFERLLLRLPFFKQVYPAFKEMSLFLFLRDKQFAFQQVVLLQYPRVGIYSIGFLTNNAPQRICEKITPDLCYVFIPTTPSPWSGFVMLVPRKDLIFPELTVEEAIKVIVSGGVIVRPD